MYRNVGFALPTWQSTAGYPVEVQRAHLGLDLDQDLEMVLGLRLELDLEMLHLLFLELEMDRVLQAHLQVLLLEMLLPQRPLPVVPRVGALQALVLDQVLVQDQVPIQQVAVLQSSEERS